MIKRTNYQEFKHNKSNGGINYIFINHDTRQFTTDYYLQNGGHYPLENTRLKVIKYLEQQCITQGYEEVR